MAQCLEVDIFPPLISILCWLDKERASVRPEQSTSQFVSSNSANTENLSSTSRPRSIENDRLPGTVLLARARLLERLRGEPLSRNRSVLRYAFWYFSSVSLVVP